MSRTRVAADDPAFHRPSKPIGRYLTRDEAQPMISHGQQWEDRGEHGWRRVVASPEPLECLDSPAAVALLNAGYVVVCSGGGGIPVVPDSAGAVHGVEAVIDKDLTAALLAVELSADRLVIATDVENVVAGWGTPEARALREISLADLEALARREEFTSGSMGPKVAAACSFVRRTGRPAAITSLACIAEALKGDRGTIVQSSQHTQHSADN